MFLSLISVQPESRYCNTTFWETFIPEMIARELIVGLILSLKIMANDNKKKENRAHFQMSS